MFKLQFVDVNRLEKNPGHKHKLLIQPL